jgi:hypothetical protein
MEIPLNIIKDALSIYQGAKGNDDLRKIGKKLERYSLDDLLLKSEEKKVLHQLSSQLHRIFITGSYEPSKLAALIKVASNYLKRYLSSGDLKLLVIFIYFNSYLKIDNNLFRIGKTNFKGKRKLVEVLKELIKKVDIKINFRPDAGYYEKNLLQDAKNGFMENDIERVYSFIESVERGMGFHFNYLLENLLLFYSQFDKRVFIDQVNRLNDPVTIVFYFQSFPRNELLSLMRHKLLKNKWVIFELIRLLVNYSSKDQKNSLREVSACSICLNKLYKFDKSFYSQAVEFLNRSNLFNASLGKQASNLDQNDTVALISKWIPLSKYDRNLVARTKLLDALMINLTSDQYHIVLQTAFFCWKELYDKISTDDNEYINDLFKTDYANFVVEYYILNSESIIIEEMGRLLNIMTWIESEWSINESHQVKLFHLYFSHLYLISHAYKNKGLKDSGIEVLLRIFEDNMKRPIHISDKCYREYLPIIINNVSS